METPNVKAVVNIEFASFIYYVVNGIEFTIDRVHSSSGN
jgi:hypothetical protein